MPTSPSPILNQAIDAARRGQREHARGLLYLVLDEDPDNLLAWVWLSEVEGDLVARITALEQALSISPNVPQLQTRLAQLRQQQQEQRATEAQAQLQHAQRAYQAHKRDEALAILLKLVEHDERNEQAWLLLSEVAPDVADQITALENALTVNPGNAYARSRLNELERIRADYIQLGQYYEDHGDIPRAREAYMLGAAHIRTPFERSEADRRLASLSDLRLNKPMRPVNPSVTLLRLASGPVVLYGLLALIQGGLNPVRVPIQLYLGLLGVMLGSLLLTLTTTRPAHPLWRSLFLKPGGMAEPIARAAVWRVGFALLIAPFAAWFLSAYTRLTALRPPW